MESVSCDLIELCEILQWNTIPSLSSGGFLKHNAISATHKKEVIKIVAKTIVSLKAITLSRSITAICAVSNFFLVFN
jgi:hypothetical protein